MLDILWGVLNVIARMAGAIWSLLDIVVAFARGRRLAHHRADIQSGKKVDPFYEKFGKTEKRE